MRSAKDEEFRVYVLARRSDLLRTATLLTAGDPHLAEDAVQATPAVVPTPFTRSI